MDTSIDKMAAEDLYEMRNRIDMNIAFQRNFVWDMKKDKDARMSKLIQSILFGRYIPPVVFWDQGEKNDNGEDIYSLIDGKQRLTTIFKFKQGGFELNPNLNYGEFGELGGKYFQDLDPELQKKIDRAKIVITFIKNASLREIEENFILINEGGVNLTKVESSIAKVGTENNERINDIISTKLFRKIFHFTEVEKRKRIPRNVAMQIIALRIAGGEATELGNMDKVAQDINKYGISLEMFDTIMSTVKYIEEALLAQDKDLKRTDMPMIFETAIKAKDFGFPPEKFGGWVQMFLDHKANKEVEELNDYRISAGAGTGKQANVAKRLKSILTHLENHIDEAPNYVIPERKTRGPRKKRDKKKETV